jgi:cytochrome P450
MRITAPPRDARIPLGEINLADTGLYVSEDAHLVWQTLRAERPLFWQAQPGGEGFWAVTRRADVRRVLAEHETFSSEGGTAIAMLDAPDPAAGLMMQATDPPRHRQFRDPLGKPFAAHAMPGYTEHIQSFVADAMATAFEAEVWDVASAFTRLPMSVAAMLMGLPNTDVGPLLRLAFASLAPRDPRFVAGTAGTAGTAKRADVAHYQIIQYFMGCIDSRRRKPSTDLISFLITMEIGGRRLTEHELLANCLSLLLGAVVTTSQAISASLIGLAEANGGEGRWPHTMDIKTAVEEALRWSSPVTHFMRRARHDIEMHDEKIRAGDAITAWIASANRDETVFEQPYVLNLERSPNRHVTFGSGSHLCLGSHLARHMLRESFRQLVTGIESFELAGDPCHLVSNEIAGVTSLPLRIRSRSVR